MSKAVSIQTHKSLTIPTQSQHQDQFRGPGEVQSLGEPHDQVLTANVIAFLLQHVKALLPSEPKNHLTIPAQFQEQVLSQKATADYLDLSITTIWRLRKNPDSGFPTPRRISSGKLGFLQSELNNWIQSRQLAA